MRSRVVNFSQFSIRIQYYSGICLRIPDEKNERIDESAFVSESHSSLYTIFVCGPKF